MITTATRKNVTVHPVPITFVGALALLFIGAKLFGAITWPWLWVLSPLWLPLAVIFSIGLLVLAAGLIYELVKK